MLQRMIRWMLLFTMLAVAVPAVPDAALAQDAADDVYQDPEGRFTVPIPTGWSAEDADGYGVLTDPEGEIIVSVMALDESDPAAAIAAAWEIVEPGFDMDPLQEDEVPTQPGTDATVVITYDIGQITGDILQGLAIMADGVAYVMLFEADPNAAVERQSQINIIAGGLAITGAEQASIEGVQPLRFAGELVQEFEDYVIETLDLLEVPGATIAIVQDGEVVYRGAFGVTELGGDTPMQPETRMMIGSTIKPMTTMMLATLVDDGIIAWDTPVVDILPGFEVADPELTPQITVQDLVCACTGVPRRDIELLFNFNDLSARGIVASLAGFEFFTPIGEAFQYSNQMVAAGGYAGAAAVHGEDADLYDAYLTEMQDRVLGPIGMEHTTFSFEDVIAADDYATPHGADLDGNYVPISLDLEAFVEPVAPSGGIWSNVDDLARYLMTGMAGGTAPDCTQVVSAENLQHTWEPQVPIDAASSYGLGWIIEDYKGQQVINHGGNTLGFTSELAFLPDSDVGIVVLTNGQASTVFNLAVRYRFLELVFELEPAFHAFVELVLEGEADATEIDTGVPVPEALPVAETTAVNPAEVEPFTGEYVNEALGSISLELVSGELYLDAGEFRTALRAIPDGHELEGATIFLTVDPPLAGLPVELRANEAGEMTVILGEAPIEYTFTPATATGATPAASPVAKPAAAD